MLKNVAVNRGYEAGCVLIEPAGRISSDLTFEYVRYAYYLLIFGFHTCQNNYLLVHLHLKGCDARRARAHLVALCVQW